MVGEERQWKESQYLLDMSYGASIVKIWVLWQERSRFKSWLHH